MKRRRHIPRRPNAFTLVELLIVIAIIAVLIALVIPLVGNVTDQARRAATKTTIKKAHELLQKRLSAFEREYAAFYLRTYNQKYSASNRQHVRQRKIDFRKTFPMSLNGQNGLPNTVGGTISSPGADTAEALYYMLTEMESFGSVAEDSGNFMGAEVKDTDGDGHPELVDGWAQPLRFYRWPTSLIQDPAARRILIKNLPANVNLDPDDPLGVLPSHTFHAVGSYHTPLIVSAGVDRKLGLYEPDDVGQSGHLAAPDGNADDLDDNITNLNNQTGND